MGNVGKLMYWKTCYVRMRSSGYRLGKLRFSKNMDKTWLTDRVGDEWKSQSRHVVNANTIESLRGVKVTMDGEGKW